MAKKIAINEKRQTLMTNNNKHVLDPKLDLQI